MMMTMMMMMIRNVPRSISLPSTGYQVLRRFFAASEYLLLLLLREANGVADCLSKHAQHKLNGCRRKCTSDSVE